MKQTLFIVSRWYFSCEFTSECWHAVCRHLCNRLERPDHHRWKVEGGDTFDSFPSPSNLSISFIPDKSSFPLWKLETSVVIQPESRIIKAHAARCEQIACRVGKVTLFLLLLSWAPSTVIRRCFPGVDEEGGEEESMFWWEKQMPLDQDDSYKWQYASTSIRQFHRLSC